MGGPETTPKVKNSEKKLLDPFYYIKRYTFSWGMIIFSRNKFLRDFLVHNDRRCHVASVQIVFNHNIFFILAKKIGSFNALHFVKIFCCSTNSFEL